MFPCCVSSCIPISRCANICNIVNLKWLRSEFGQYSLRIIIFKNKNALTHCGLTRFDGVYISQPPCALRAEEAETTTHGSPEMAVVEFKICPSPHFTCSLAGQSCKSARKMERRFFLLKTQEQCHSKCRQSSYILLLRAVPITIWVSVGLIEVTAEEEHKNLHSVFTSRVCIVQNILVV